MSRGHIFNFISRSQMLFFSYQKIFLQDTFSLKVMPGQSQILFLTYKKLYLEDTFSMKSGVSRHKFCIWRECINQSLMCEETFTNYCVCKDIKLAQLLSLHRTFIAWLIINPNSYNYFYALFFPLGLILFRKSKRCSFQLLHPY